MRPSGIGGQAVIEGIMMKNADKYSIAVRKPTGEIEVKVEDYKCIIKNKKVQKLPIVRGVINFVDSMVLGVKTLSFSASFYDEDDDSEPTKADVFMDKILKDKSETFFMGIAVAFSIIAVVALFMILPYFISNFCRQFIKSDTVLGIVEGIIRILIFVTYVLLISRMKDIRRVFMYHGSEHKCINCIENGLELTVENVRKSSKQHKRCGTSFLLIVMVVSIIFFLFIKVDSPVLRVVYRVLLVPIIAGVSYEFIRLAGRTENKLVDLLSRPGMWMQNLTTKEPEEDMIEVAIRAVEAVFDWEQFQEEERTAKEMKPKASEG